MRLTRPAFRRAWRLGVLCAALAILPGCTALVDSPFFRGNDVNLLEIDYAAADMLAHNAKGMLKPGTPVRVGALADAYPEMAPPPQNAAPLARAPQPLAAGTPAPPAPVPLAKPAAPFGKVVIEQIAGRWVDLGFNVVGGSGVARPGQAVLGGQYARANGKVIINLHLTDAGTGRILAVYDYTMPISSEINDLLGAQEYNSSFFKF
jgi:hypothetical protein